MIARERGLLQRQLRDEVPLGVMSAAQYGRALSPWTMSLAFLRAARQRRASIVCAVNWRIRRSS